MLEAQRTQLARRAPPVSEPSRTLPQAQRTEQFAEFLARSPELDGVVTVPKVYRAASASRLLTLERLYGVPLIDLESVRESLAGGGETPSQSGGC